jgi:hypothetical protein
MPSGVRMEAAGHIHFFQAVDFGGVHPPQLVVGTGGDKLSVVPPVSMIGADINGLKVVNSVTYSGFALYGLGPPRRAVDRYPVR